IDPQGIIRFQQVSKECRRTVIANLPHLFPIHRMLKIFFDSPTDFRALQARTGAIISGSFALQFFSQVYYSDTDLDIYVHYGAREILGSWILGNDYKYISRKITVTVGNVEDSASTLEYGQEILGVLEFQRKRGDVEKKVQIIIVEESPLAAIMEFHSTCVLNFITFDMAYCLYPKATLIYQTNLVLKNPDVLVRKALSKYRRRGFTCRRLIAEQGSLFLPDSVRWVGDSQTWTLSL
ncbi:hypothetical protein BDY19DRAFT_858899, partial [Irpex rosettiformis]